MSFNFLKFEKNDFTGTLKISRPEALNALNQDVLRELEVFFKDFVQQQNLRVLVLTGDGEKSFVAGADIKFINSLNSQTAQEFASYGQKIFRLIEQCEIPVIAAVNGFALGGGLELALSCDFIIASEKAKFALPEVSLGLIPGFGGTVRLSRVVGINKARELTYTGEMINAQEAYRIQLANIVVPPEQLQATAQKIADNIIKQGPLAISAAKKSILKSYDESIDTAMATEAGFFSKLFSTDDVKEGTLAFIEKRKAQFKGQ